ncbi:aldehyde dehydrogenase family protein [Gallaecimonas mangrovi]|uniref:aldehyde dehydrogenase family protein n=1 Tax=Gallaecimonas mangrovi TaxID=2291597 RepID=UPI000E20AF7C|nr:aldehyde dehydrogenase family protein [Gallaecimonas mangrovi]
MQVIELSHVIGGEKVLGEATLAQYNPANAADLKVAIPAADQALVCHAVAAAKAAFLRFRDQGIEARSDALLRAQSLINARSDELAKLIARETGKTLGDAKGEVGRAARIFGFFAGEALRIVGERLESTRNGAMVEIEYAPLGVIGQITPWNFPIAIPAWKIAPALAYGNTVVWKPSELSSATAQALMDIIGEVGVLPGAVNMVLGGGETGAAICHHPEVNALSFTGSVATGKKVRMAAAERGVAVQTEMGGVNALLVLKDSDLNSAVETALNGAFLAAGQRCTATSRIIVEEAIADAFVARLSERVAEHKVGDPLAADTHIGPLASANQKALISRQTAAMEQHPGARLVFGGTAEALPECFFAPTLFDHANAADPIAQEEIFGPVAAVFRVADYDAGLAMVNDSRFGLSAGLCTGSLKYAEHFKRYARAGMLMINLPTAGIDYHVPFGGVGASSYGAREQGRAAKTFYTVTRTTYLKA